MASEITVNAYVTVSNNGVVSQQNQSASIDQAGDVALEEVRSVSTAAAAISFGSISGAPSVVMLKNLDATNYINYGPSNPPTEFKLPAGHIAIFQPSSATQYWKANTAAVLTLIKATEA